MRYQFWMHDAAPRSRPTADGAELAISTFGLALVAAAMAANQQWLDRHFLPSFFVPRHWYVLIESAVRLLIGLVGVACVFGRRRLVRLISSAPLATLQVVVAVILAVAASEFVMRSVHLRPTEWLRP